MYAPHLESWQCLHTFQERSLNIVDPRSSVASITHVTLSLLPPSTLRRPSVPPAPSRSSVPPGPPLQFQGACATMVQSVLLEFDKRKAHTSFLFSALRTLCSSSWAVAARARRHVEASAEGSEAACSGMGSHCHAARQSQAVSLLLLQSDPTQ